jgi:hypothetical protein
MIVGISKTADNLVLNEGADVVGLQRDSRLNDCWHYDIPRKHHLVELLVCCIDRTGQIITAHYIQAFQFRETKNTGSETTNEVGH